MRETPRCLGCRCDRNGCGTRRSFIVSRSVGDFVANFYPTSPESVNIDISSSSVNRMEIYAGLRVPEVWRYDGRSVTFFQLGPDGQYVEKLESLCFTGLRPADVLRFLEMGSTMDKIRWARELREWVRGELYHRKRVD